MLLLANHKHPKTIKIKMVLNNSGNLTLDGDLIVNDAVVFNGATSGSVTIAAPAIAGSQAYTLPTALPAVTGYVLSGTTGGVLSWVPNPDVNTTYDFNASSTTGGANLNLVGSDSTTDTVKLSDGGGITATYTSGTEVTLGSTATSANTASAIVARDGSGNFSASGATLGNVTVGVDTDQTISTTSGNLVLQTAAGVNSGTITIFSGSTGNITLEPSTTGDIHLNSDAIRIGNANATATLATRGTGNLVLTTNEGSGVEGTITIANGANGDITLAPNGTGNVILSDDSYVLGQLVATRNTAYVAPPSPLTTLAGQNGIVVASSSGGAGYGANIAVRYYSGDTTAGTTNAASLNFSGATGTNSAPGGAGANQVLGSSAYDGYTAGTSNNFASQIATANQGAGTSGIQPLQAQGYARQAFTNSTTVTTAVTGASGTGTTATLTFTTQNTAPYVVGQTVVIAGMTPSGYDNAAAVITAATTSSISYANTTTGFTSGGTIAAVNTVTAAGTGFRVRGFANSTNMTAGNRFNFMDLTASAATFKSNAYTFANEVITGSTLTATNYLTLGATAATFAASTGTYATLNSTSTTLAASGVTYATMSPTSSVFTNTGINTFIRTGAVTAQVPAVQLRYQRTDQTGPQDNDGVDFRLGVGGTATNVTVARFDAQYKASGDNEIGMSVSADSFSADTDRIYIGSRAQTRIRATPSGGGTTSDIITATDLSVASARPIAYPSYTTAARDALTPAAGWVLFNSTTVKLQCYDGANWQDLF
jgi:hypothetical protein